MAKKRKSPTPAKQASDYDGAWKEALRQYFQLILSKYFPAVAAAIDWTYPPEWSDKELSRIFRRSRRRPKSVDVLAKVRLVNGAEQWVLLHLEVQSGRETDFEFRVSRYNSGLTWIYEQRVVTLVVLADLDPAWRPHEDCFRLGDFESRLRFPVCKLGGVATDLPLDRLDDEPAGGSGAAIYTRANRTGGEPEYAIRELN